MTRENFQSRYPDPADVNLVGWHLRVPVKSNPIRFWNVTVLEQRGKFLKAGDNGNAGSPWWTMISEATHLSPPRKAKRCPE
jgi:hypothetical protein